MAIHRIYLDAGSIPARGANLSVTGDEAKHALRVKRVTTGDLVELLDGAGTIATAVVLKPDGHASEGSRDTRREWLLALRIESRNVVDPVAPGVHVLSATPKGPRLEEMIDGLCQVGAASWAPLATARGVVDPREGKLQRIHRVAVEASKQCGRAWILRTGAGVSVASLLEERETDAMPIVVADSSGVPYAVTGRPQLRLLIGPEGGWTPAELEAARGAGATVCTFGRHTMRIEVAAVVAAGIIMDCEGRASLTGARRERAPSGD